MTITATAAATPPTAQHLTAAAKRLRADVYRTDSCLARIIDREDPTWDPTVDYGGGHGNTSESYGLGQANPGTKMAAYGPSWATDARTQLRWARAYAGRYGGTCAAWAWWQQHSSW